MIWSNYFFFKYALRKRLTSSTSDKTHWIDHAINKYSEIEMSSTKAALEVLYIFIAYPIFWALYEQLVNIAHYLSATLKIIFQEYINNGFEIIQGSRWVLQATLMNCKIQGIDWEIKPDQIQTIHPICALLLTLSFKSCLFPFLAKFGIRKPLQKLIFSYAMAMLAFMFATILQYKIFVSQKHKIHI